MTLKAYTPFPIACEVTNLKESHDFEHKPAPNRSSLDIRCLWPVRPGRISAVRAFGRNLPEALFFRKESDLQQLVEQIETTSPRCRAGFLGQQFVVRSILLPKRSRPSDPSFDWRLAALGVVSLHSSSCYRTSRKKRWAYKLKLSSKFEQENQTGILPGTRAAHCYKSVAFLSK